MTRHERFMARAVELAKRGQGRTHPNPCVGCVIVRGDEIIGEGYHPRAGEPHAEVMALRSVAPGEDVSDCELYVTLEPCCVHGRTPPCTLAIERAGIMRVFVGAVDPDERMRGKGLEVLRARGVEVTQGVLERECIDIIRPFAKRSLQGLPWVEAKWAMTLDGKIASRLRQPTPITSAAARMEGHRLRDRLDAILVGTHTVLADDPLLTCRLEGGRDPWRIICDARLDIGLNYNIMDPSTSTGRTVIFTGVSADEGRVEERRARGLEVVRVATDARGYVDVEAMLRELARMGLNSVLVEGGGRLLGSLWDARLIDAVNVFVAPKLLGGEGAPTPLGGLGLETLAELEEVEVSMLGAGEVLWRGLVPKNLQTA